MVALIPGHSAGGGYAVLGKMVMVNVSVTVTAIGSCTGYLTISLPVANSSAYQALAGLNINIGQVMQATLQPGSGTFTTSSFNNSGIASSGHTLAYNGVFSIP